MARRRQGARAARQGRDYWTSLVAEFEASGERQEDFARPTLRVSQPESRRASSTRALCSLRARCTIVNN